VLTRQHDMLFRALHVGVVFVGALFLDDLPAWIALAADVDERRFLAHNAREAVAVVTEAGCITRQKSLRILEQRVERVGILALVVPGEYAAVRHHRTRRSLVHEVM